MRYLARSGDRAIRVELDPRRGLLVDGSTRALDVARVADGVWSVILDGRSHEVVLLERDPLRVRVDGREATLELADERRQAAGARMTGTAATSFELRAPMPGLIVAVHVREGDVVDEGASVCTLEAMKMENELAVPRRGRVTRLAARAGAKVNGGDLLAVLAPG